MEIIIFSRQPPEDASAPAGSCSGARQKMLQRLPKDASAPAGRCSSGGRCDLRKAGQFPEQALDLSFFFKHNSACPCVDAERISGDEMIAAFCN